MIAGQQTIDATTVKQLRHQIASVISEQKAYNVPSVCCRYGLDDGTGEEAFQSKYKYVMRRVDRLPSDDILRIARALQSDEPSMDLGEVLAKFDEKVKPLVTALTRRRIVAELDDVALSGSLPEIEFLSKLWPITSCSRLHRVVKEQWMLTSFVIDL